MSVDLPAFGRPTIATLSGLAGSSRPPLRPASSVIVLGPARQVRQQRLEQVGQALAVLGRKRHRVAEAERERLVGARHAGPALGLVGDAGSPACPSGARARRRADRRAGCPARASMTNRMTSASAIAASVCGAHAAEERSLVRLLEARPCRRRGTRGRRGAPRPRAGRGSRPAGRRRARACGRRAG